MKELLVFLFLISPVVKAQTLYYIGVATETDMTNGSVVQNPYLIARTMDQTAGTIVESSISAHGSTFAEFSSTMQVTGNNVSMTESTGTVIGSGTLTGTPWAWTFLHAEFHFFNTRIVDYNFFAEAGSILGHKDFYVTQKGGENLVQEEDVVLHVVDQAAYNAKRAELLH